MEGLQALERATGGDWTEEYRLLYVERRGESLYVALECTLTANLKGRVRVRRGVGEGASFAEAYAKAFAAALARLVLPEEGRERGEEKGKRGEEEERKKLIQDIEEAFRVYGEHDAEAVATKKARHYLAESALGRPFRDVRELSNQDLHRILQGLREDIEFFQREGGR